MKIRYRINNFTMAEETKERISQKIDKIKDSFNEDTVFDIFLERKNKDFKCEIKVQNGRDFIRSEEKGKGPEYSFDNALSTLKKRVRKIKSMNISKERGNTVLSLKELNRIEENDKDNELIEKRKEFELESVIEEEAILALEELNHAFYVFRNKDLRDRICIVYRREVGYGILEIK